MKNSLQDIRTNLSLLVLIPAFLGGLWQVFELYSLDPFLIRFFSVSQAFADGALLVFFLLSPFVALYLLWLFVNVFKTEETEQINKHLLETKEGSTVLSKVCMLFIPLLLIILGFVFINYKLNFPNVFMVTVLDLCIGLCVDWMLSGLALNQKIKYSKVEIHSIVKKVLISLFCISVFFTFRQFLIDSRNFSTVGNFEYLKSLLASKEIKNFDVKYFNDKFLFVENNDDNKIYVIEVNSIIVKSPTTFKVFEEPKP